MHNLHLRLSTKLIMSFTLFENTEYARLMCLINFSHNSNLFTNTMNNVYKLHFRKDFGSVYSGVLVEL